MDRRLLLDLIEKYLAGKTTEEEKQSLLDWYQSSDYTHVEWPSTSPNEEQLVRTRILQNLRPLYQEYLYQEYQPRPNPVRRMVRIGSRAAAALAGLALILILVEKFKAAGPENYISVYNPAGKLQQVTLPDGTKIWLSANTHLLYQRQFADNREVKLEGEAFFEVAPSPKPFVVHTRELETKVLGTSFDIQSYEKSKNTSITLISGKIAVTEPQTGTTNILNPGEQITLDHTTKQLDKTSQPTNNTEWRKGELVFDLVTLEDIGLQLENWYGYHIHFKDPSLKRYRYSARFKNSIPLKDLLSIL